MCRDGEECLERVFLNFSLELRSGLKGGRKILGYFSRFEVIMILNEFEFRDVLIFLMDLFLEG